ncbi:hypothetical protein GW891_01475 [bacterium]|nr:hypothetical protein [bacterium]
MFTSDSQYDKIILFDTFKFQYFLNIFINSSSTFFVLSIKSKSKSVENLSKAYKK